MLDAISAIESQLKKPEFDSKYSADQAITSVQFSEISDTSLLTVVFPAWHMPAKLTARLQQQLMRQGSSVLMYNFNPLILEDDIIKVKSSFEFIALAVAEDVSALVSHYHFKTVNLLGISVGGVALCIVAEKLPKFHSVTMLAPGNDLAAALWAGWRTRRLRNSIRARGYRLADLEKEWADLAPQNHIQTLKTHPVQIILARKDHFIPYSLGRELYKELKSVNPNTTCTTSRFGHVATILRYVH